MALQFTRDEWNVAYRVALVVLRTPDQAEDAAQDAMLRAYRYRHRFSGKAKPESWLYRIAYNTALSYLRRPFQRRYSSEDVFRLLDDENQHDQTASPLRQVLTQELAGQLERCMSELGADDRVAFTERFLLDTSERDLGRILGVSTNAAKQRAFRARRRVREHMIHEGAAA